MKPILILRIPQDAVDSIPELRKAIARSFRQFKTSVIFDDAKQKGFKISVINTTRWADEIIERDVMELAKDLELAKYVIKPYGWRYGAETLTGLVTKVLKARIKNFFYFGKWVD